MLEELDNIEVCDEGILGLRGNSRVVSLNIESYEEWTFLQLGSKQCSTVYGKNLAQRNPWEQQVPSSWLRCKV